MFAASHARIAVLTLLASVSYHEVVAGEWVKVATREETVFYLDHDATHKQGDLISIRLLRDCGTEQTYMGSMYGYSWRSAILEIEYNCAMGLRRQMTGAWFAENKAQGRRTFVKNHPEDWSPVQETGMNDVVWNSVCGR
jgi:hypothetical protein